MKRIIATGWLVFRRLIAMLGSLVMAYAAWYFWESDHLLFILSVCMACFLLFFSIYGRRDRYSTFHQDKADHLKRKKRYGWRL